MRPLLPLLAAAALLAWLHGRRRGWREWMRAYGEERRALLDPKPTPYSEDEDGVQPADPVTLVSDSGWFQWDHNGLFRSGDVRPPPAPQWGTYTTHPANHTTGYDPTYIEAREVAIRRGGQSSEYSTEGM